MINAFLEWLGWRSALPLAPLNASEQAFLEEQVSFYAQLQSSEKLEFERRCLLFLQSVEIVGNGFEPSIEDELLVASGSVILAWGFMRWYYVRVDQVILVADSFNQHSEFGQDDSGIQGLVGSHHLAGRMILSQPALHAGFSNDQDKLNVALHEFSHLIDMSDGDVDGFPEQLSKHSFEMPWLALVQRKTEEILRGESNIRPYATVNKAEFFAVASEYFFERPKMLKTKHPQVYRALSDFYKQDRAELRAAVKVRSKDPCLCGSGRRYKRCCMPN
ncbi:MAG: Mlc titration factor MtfA (ptsG expression regulator) [Cryomorphaceae bacterium]|jgi:Mlc titration factor MtfA (ptsG expression regulator)